MNKIKLPRSPHPVFDTIEFEESETAVQILNSRKSKMVAKDAVRMRLDHTSNNTMCPRKVIYNAQQPHTDATIENFIRGESIHHSIQKTENITEYSVSVEGFVGHIDLIRNGTPIEIYSTMLHSDFTPAEYPLKVSQLIEYIRMLLIKEKIKTLVGEILIFHMVRPQVNVVSGLPQRRLKSWKINITPEQMNENHEMLERHKAAQMLWLEKDIIPEPDPMITSAMVECDFCDYFERCWK